MFSQVLGPQFEKFRLRISRSFIHAEKIRPQTCHRNLPVCLLQNFSQLLYTVTSSRNRVPNKDFLCKSILFTTRRHTSQFVALIFFNRVQCFQTYSYEASVRRSLIVILYFTDIKKHFPVYFYQLGKLTAISKLENKFLMSHVSMR